MQTNAYIHIISDLIENQFVAGSMLECFRTLPDTNGDVFYDFAPVLYMTPKRQLVSSIGIKITDRDLNPLPASKTPTMAILHFRAKI